jgi:hypothetical protein
MPRINPQIGLGAILSARHHVEQQNDKQYKELTEKVFANLLSQITKSLSTVNTDEYLNDSVSDIFLELDGRDYCEYQDLVFDHTQQKTFIDNIKKMITEHYPRYSLHLYTEIPENHIQYDVPNLLTEFGTFILVVDLNMMEHLNASSYSDLTSATVHERPIKDLLKEKAVQFISEIIAGDLDEAITEYIQWIENDQNHLGCFSLTYDLGVLMNMIEKEKSEPALAKYIDEISLTEQRELLDEVRNILQVDEKRDLHSWVYQYDSFLPELVISERTQEESQTF